jgi:hypothetical protein
MIKLSDVKVRAQYRVRVRYRLMVLACAGEHGSTAGGRKYGVSVRRSDGGESGGGPAGSRGSCRGIPCGGNVRLSPAVLGFIRQARQELGYGAARTRAALSRRTTTPILGEEEQMADCKEVLHLGNVRWTR